MYNDYFRVVNTEPRRWGASLALVVVLFVFSAAGTAERLSLCDFNPAPELPYESTSFEQDALYDEAKELGRKEEALAACRALRQDSSAPWELQRWATLREVEILTRKRQQRAALDLAKAWLHQNPDDPGALEIRVELARIVSYEKHSGFMPTFQEIDEIFTDIFNNHDQDQEFWPVVQARVQYAQKLQNFYYFDSDRDWTVYARSVEQLYIARQCLEKRAEDETLSAQERKRAESYLEYPVLPMLSSAQGLGVKGKQRDLSPEAKEFLRLLEQGGTNAPGGAPEKE